MAGEQVHQHISKQFEQELENLRHQVLAMGGLVESQLADAVKSLLENDVALAEEVIANDYKVNSMEVEIDEKCTEILARRQPAARDLRLVLAVIKMIADLERIGDEARGIARQSLDLSTRQPRRNQLSELEQLARQVRSMLHDALDAFARMDVDLALKVVEEDKVVDQEYETIVRQQITYMMEDARNIPIALDIMWSARSLERIGDRSCNMCEYLIYYVKGKDVRHISLEQLEQEIQR
ncbi:phosphate transport system protein [Methylomarinovum caldicuralii]|uniref:Phosphate-specific transport system accessory protein PhoU n=1 Tax=Methylomarinovum caldicuralii TaxID=438856 RepID=A0AAU9CXA8_9GAMM|nr:phosphate signaling complex protein PhoU [Methylomarinovum caldicuralii]BCX82642.1 phosphate transport system protein [Methylomarinovum caldicuralii]